ncbi:fungal specific transcription factor domain-containing protein [Aspergillus ruber CBS 135680]|uniref:Xylanolytic transcriptional activator regulatory domain-containing protein n=1 Tax=Aspergillus ruber (strain CBS 135680) TaxID=1388766 RepID=A0A017SHU3_ASPRC|nr:uncharacterized protein EURHEDRAFT_401424 [Aspergillus ruber CBS 135680]EYE96331.1 hypothetical protein EURHEDRAFT_401424 [Aspergillus ruber CBS 135680]
MDPLLKPSSQAVFSSFNPSADRVILPRAGPLLPSQHRQRARRACQQEINKEEFQQLKKQNEKYKFLLLKFSERAGYIVDDINQVLEPQTKQSKDAPSLSHEDSSSSYRSMWSSDAEGVINEDISRNEESRATGFLEKTSELSQLQNLHIETESCSRPGHALPRQTSSGTSHENHITSECYHANEALMLKSKQLNLYDLPPRHTADKYCDIYFNFVNIHFSIVRRSLFLSHHSDLQLVQIEALIAFYFLVQSQVGRAWKMIRIASSSAIALGINLRNVDDKTDSICKESRCRLWCSIFMLEHSLATMTGRPSSLNGTFSVHPPFPYSECSFSSFPASRFLNDDSERERIANWTLFENNSQTKARFEQLQSIRPNSSLYFTYQMDLSHIASMISSRIYGVPTLWKEWDQVESSIKLYSQKLTQWLSTIHTSFAFADSEGELLQHISTREQVGLALYYYSTRILINRPCLSRSGLRKNSDFEFPRSHFSNDAAITCLRSALLLISVLPDEPSQQWFYTISPWWTMRHFIIQAINVLLVHLSVNSAPVQTGLGSEQTSEMDTTESLSAVFSSCKKALCWLHHIANHDLACRPSFEVCSKLLHRIALSKDLGLEGVPSAS